MANLTFTGVFEDIDHEKTFEANLTVKVHPAAGEYFEEFVDNVYTHSMIRPVRYKCLIWNHKVYENVVEVINDYPENFELYIVGAPLKDDIVIEHLDWIK